VNTAAFDRLKAVCPTISVGILTADLLNLGSEVAILEEAGVKLVHFDVADGCFCPMMTIGPAFIKAVKTPLLKDVHLLIQDPFEKVEAFVDAGADIITVHVEAAGDMLPTLRKLRGVIRGIALNPGTPMEAIEPLLDEVEMIEVLAVVPGVSSKFEDSTPGRLARARRMIGRRDILFCVDGGIKRENIAEVAKLGADIIVTGSAVFDGKDPRGNARFMLAIMSDRSDLSDKSD
jgi:ribulose-phosphate 3-epimerase